MSLHHVRVGVVEHDGHWHAFVERDDQLSLSRDTYQDHDDAVVVAMMEAERIGMELRDNGVRHMRLP